MTYRLVDREQQIEDLIMWYALSNREERYLEILEELNKKGLKE